MISFWFSVFMALTFLMISLFLSRSFKASASAVEKIFFTMFFGLHAETELDYYIAESESGDD